MVLRLTKYKLEQIRKKLPPSIQFLKDEYPQTTYNISEAWDLEPLPDGYVPDYIGVFYGDDARGSHICLSFGELLPLKLTPPPDKDVVKVSIDDEWAYIQIKDKVLLDRLGGVVLPDLFLDTQKLLDLSLAHLDLE